MNYFLPFMLVVLALDSIIRAVSSAYIKMRWSEFNFAAMPMIFLLIVKSFLVNVQNMHCIPFKYGRTENKLSDRFIYLLVILIFKNLQNPKPILK